MVATMTLSKPSAVLAGLRPTSTLLGFRTFATSHDKTNFDFSDLLVDPLHSDPNLLSSHLSVTKFLTKHCHCC